MDTCLLDNGSQKSKYGRASWLNIDSEYKNVTITKDKNYKTDADDENGDELPTCETCLSESKYLSITRPEKIQRIGSFSKDVYNVYAPVEKGIIGDYDRAEKIWQHILKKLSFNPGNDSVMMTSTALAPVEQSEKIANIFFETFNCERFFICSPEFMSLIANGRETGLVVHFGRSIVSYTPAVYGALIKRKVTDQPLGMLDIEEYMKVMQGITDDRLETEKKKLETYNNVRPDGKYKLPDQTELQPYQMPPEVLFNPRFGGKEFEKGVVEFTNDFIMNYDIDYRKDFLKNLLLTGKTSKIKGFDNRFHNDLKNILPNNYKASYDDKFEDINKTFSPLIGSYITSKLLNETNCWITKDDYYEKGIGRCFVGYC